MISPTLPPDLSRFIGRARELREITVIVAPGRLVTLLGPGGCGKTRLAAPAVIERWRAGRKEGRKEGRILTCPAVSLTSNTMSSLATPTRGVPGLAG
jgi:ABC-type phosphate transport system ATPase subunit